MLAKNLEGVSVVVDKNRVKGGRFAVEHLDADTLLLDDGMQYLDLAHGLDIVLVDSGAPFGTEALLPRGTLREPPKNLRRAGYILITKCDGGSNEELVRRIRRYNRPPRSSSAPTARSIWRTSSPASASRWISSRTSGSEPSARSPCPRPSRDRWGSSARASRSAAASPTTTDSPRRDVDKFMQRCVERDMQLIVTTEKDAVRFPRPASIDVPVYFLRIEVEILKGREAWDDLIRRLCHPEPAFESVLRHRAAFSE